MHRPLQQLVLACGLAIAAAIAVLAAPANMVHIRGVVKSVTASSITLSTADGLVMVSTPKKPTVVDLVPASRSLITAGRFVGITSVTGPGGVQRAVEVHVFPESMRGAGEGSRPWDYPGTGAHGSKMTNGAVSMAHPGSRMTNGMVKAKAKGESIVVTYKGASGSGSQTIVIPPGIPVVTFHPGAPADLKLGASVFVMATKSPTGALKASRIMVGKDGAKPPM